ncbi:GDSL esterase/lipase At3g48460 [Rhodamnia argentea]|uniref:GDSL esterase/lipase At3g48460 n=1 Tax=Rhodamnia argentea TaxID=178133 RepID=A0A8B8P906_9MYRT|nr:GDSL esterase/lipase At3g48460 [Rhodamnia argentea]
MDGCDELDSLARFHTRSCHSHGQHYRGGASRKKATPLRLGSFAPRVRAEQRAETKMSPSPSSSSSSSIILTALAVVTLTTLFFFSSPASAAGPQPRPFKKIYAFGDSFTDTGNTRSASGPSGFGHVSNPPYGVTFFHRPTNRYSDGRLVIDFVAQSLSLPFLPPYRSISSSSSSSSSTAAYGVNFAVAGSTAINHEFFVRNNMSLDITPQSILTQLIWFNKYLESHEGCKAATRGGACRDSLEDALVWVGEIGVNDYAYTVGSAVSGDTIRKLAINTVAAFLESLLRRGVKYMVVQGLPVSGCLPLAMYLSPEDDRDDIGCVKSVNDQTRAHNAALLAKISDLRKRFPDSMILYADYWNAYHSVMKNPAKYSFKEPFKACCGAGEPYHFSPIATCGTPTADLCPRPSEYVNWDGVHLTEAMYKVIADMFLKGRFSHPPFSYLLSKKRRGG